MDKPKRLSSDTYLIYFIEHKKSRKWLTEKYIGHEFTSDPNEALGFTNYNTAEDYLSDLRDPDLLITEHEFAYIK